MFDLKVWNVTLDRRKLIEIQKCVNWNIKRTKFLFEHLGIIKKYIAKKRCVMIKIQT